VGKLPPLVVHSAQIAISNAMPATGAATAKAIARPSTRSRQGRGVAAAAAQGCATGAAAALGASLGEDDPCRVADSNGE